MKMAWPLALLLPLLFGAFIPQKKAPRVLVFSKAVGFRHSSIPVGVAAVQKMGAQHGFAVDTTSNAALFIPAQLRLYQAVIFLNTTGDLLDSAQQQSFKKYMQNGGGFVGVHAASDAEYDWPWYGQMVGGYFESHPKQQTARLAVTNATHPATKQLPKAWTRFDEWYNFKALNPAVKVLLTIDESSYEGGNNGAHHPMAWYHHFDGGRAFYTALGHTEASYTEALFLQHLLGGIRWAMGAEKAKK